MWPRKPCFVTYEINEKQIYSTSMKDSESVFEKKKSHTSEKNNLYLKKKEFV